jgi:arylformamidase
MIDIIARINGRPFLVDIGSPIHIAIPLYFDGPQPNAYGVEPAVSRVYEGGGFIGDTRRGGSCNFETLTLTPHCNGTHTECIGHLSFDRLSVHEMLKEALIPATVLSVIPERALSSPESYLLLKEEEDAIITSAALSEKLRHADPDFLDALVVRALPNGARKCAIQYSENPAPFFSIESMHFLVSLGVRHLLTDLPSLDRADDDGRMSAHRVFWNVPAGTHAIDPATASPRTVTEMIYVPDEAPDGRYLLNLQIAGFMSDAAPSRPILFPIQPAPQDA